MLISEQVDLPSSLGWVVSRLEQGLCLPCHGEAVAAVRHPRDNKRRVAGAWECWASEKTNWAPGVPNCALSCCAAFLQDSRLVQSLPTSRSTLSACPMVPAGRDRLI